MVRVGDVAGQLVQLGRADRADFGGGGVRVGGGGGVAGVACGCFEGGETGGEGGMEEGPGGEGDQGVVGGGEEGGEVVVPGWRVHFLNGLVR